MVPSNGGCPSWRLTALATLASFLLFTSPVTSQTWSTCNPTKQSGCPADPALGRSVSVDFTSGASNEFTAAGNPTYSSEGVGFPVSRGGEAPTLTSKWYIMFGKYSVTMKAAPGTGIVSSLVLQSDDLDEIDWEWLGGKPNEVQSNYFGKGQTTTYDRAAIHAVSNTQQQWHTYSVEWTASQIIWQIDGATVRVLSAANANGQFPQTPMQLKLGSWSGGDPSNSPGTIQWAGGLSNYANAPYTMYVKSLSVVDYSTGTSYSYSDQSGSAGSIVAAGGKVSGNTGGSVTANIPAPAITNTSPGNDAWDGTHRTNTATVSYTSYEGLPSGWVVTSSGKVRPPSGAATSTPPPSPSSPSPSSSPASSPAQPPLPSCAPPSSEATAAGPGSITTTRFDDRGFLTAVTIPAHQTTIWNAQGQPVVSILGAPAAASPSACAAQAIPVPSDNVATTAGSAPTAAITAPTQPTTTASAYSSSQRLSLTTATTTPASPKSSPTKSGYDSLSNAIMSGISGPAPTTGGAAGLSNPTTKFLVTFTMAGTICFALLV